MTIQIACEVCQSTDVTRDAWAEWDEDRQEWRLGAVFDDGYCHRCQTWRTLAERPLLDALESHG